MIDLFKSSAPLEIYYSFISSMLTITAMFLVCLFGIWVKIEKIITKIARTQENEIDRDYVFEINKYVFIALIVLFIVFTFFIVKTIK